MIPVKKDREQGLYVISVAARLADVHPQTLRLYERRGLLCPARTPHNRRTYSDADIERLKRIKELTQTEGLNLSGVRKVLRLEEEVLRMRRKVGMLEKELAEMRARLVRRKEEEKRHFALSKKPPAKLAILTTRPKV